MNFETCDVENLFLFKKDAEKKNDSKQRRLLKQLLKNLINEGESVIRKKLKNKGDKSDKVTVKRPNTKIRTSEIETVLTSRYPELKIKKLEPRGKTSTSTTIEVKQESPPNLTCSMCAKPFDTQETHICIEIDTQKVKEIDETEKCLSESESVEEECHISDDVNDTPLSDSETEVNNDVVTPNSDSETIEETNGWFEANFDIPPTKKRKAKPTQNRFKKDDPLYLELMVFECSICGQDFSTETEFDKHLKTNSSCLTDIPENDIKFKCRECNKYFQSSKGLRNHIRILHSKDSRKLICNYCNRVFSSKGVFDKHVFKVHELRLYPCNLCDKSYSDKHKLERHVNAVHHKLYKQVCPVCGIVLLGGYGLQRHMYTHSDLKLFKCDQCPAAYKIKMDLTTHLRLHTGERPYSCTVCLRKFTNNSSLHKHMRSHGDYVIIKNEGFKK